MSTGAFLDRFGLRFAAGARATVGVLMAVTAPFAAPPAGALVCVPVAVALAAWSLAYLRLMRTRPAAWVWVVDVAVMCGLCLAQPLLVDPTLLVRSLGWVSPVASLAVVALQWHVRPWPAALATVAVCAAFTAGAALSPEISVVQALAVGGVWTGVEAALSRMLWLLVRRGGAAADERMARRFAAERTALLARARRREQRAHWATVHDTAASTLLMVGLGSVRGDEPWLEGQLQRDVAALHGVPAPDAGVAATVRHAVAHARIPVDLRADGDLDLPGPAAAAFGGALTETLENVARHAGTDRAEVRVEVGEAAVRVTVRDDGSGFDPAAVPAGRLGLVRSVRERMDLVDGRAEIRSAPGHGTVVRLEWPRTESTESTESGPESRTESEAEAGTGDGAAAAPAVRSERAR
ncbi:sensor histidine kinase [Pseudonocardia oroxyli]|uniref:Signal transduction histidine kinase n=1 Tax=Pseudonocardia oroxyli TaxID=366584 RepID=A0A1G7S4K4_PSEOR|nr:ATP-binding protein [Pseudonocardia oroxyli]SDG17957.1 Signal transduction histidine kinase [Pseudonocardia oroxyli]